MTVNLNFSCKQQQKENNDLNITIHKECSEKLTFKGFKPFFYFKKVDIINNKNERWTSFLKPIQTTANKINIYIKDNKEITECELPDSIKQGLLKIILNGTPCKDFCCIDLVNFVWNKYSNNKTNQLDALEWLLKPMQDEKDLIAGDCICLTKDEDNDILKFKHFAIYLGKGQYISMFGSLRLFVTDLNEMKNFYETKGMLSLRPKLSK